MSSNTSEIQGISVTPEEFASPREFLGSLIENLKERNPAVAEALQRIYDKQVKSVKLAESVIGVTFITAAVARLSQLPKDSPESNAWLVGAVAGFAGLMLAHPIIENAAFNRALNNAKTRLDILNTLGGSISTKGALKP